MGDSTKVKKNSDLGKLLQKRMDNRVLAYLVIGFFAVGLAFMVDRRKEEVYAFTKMITDKFLGDNCDLYGGVRELKHGLRKNIDNYCNLVTTLDTILTAAVIFFYSIQDSKRGGIPHRKILAYTFGSFTVPVLFLVTLLMLPFYYVMHSWGLSWTTFVSMGFTYITQIIIVAIILISTSYQYSVWAIVNAEIKQYQALNKLEIERQKASEAGTAVDRVNRELDFRFSWVYLQHHLEQVAVSDELSIDKLSIARRILRVPYYKGKVKWKEVSHEPRIADSNSSDKSDKQSVEGIQNNHPKMIYEFYHRNLLAVFAHIVQPGDLEYCNKIYLILYEFLEELTEIYEKKAINRNCYAMTISGIVNAVLSSGAKNAEGFCNYVFNHVICRKDWNAQLTLYFLFHEYMYRTNSGNVRLADIEGIKDIREWEIDIEKEIELYALSWDIWLEQTTVSQGDRYRYFGEALRGLEGEPDANTESPIAYARQMIEGMKYI